MPKTTTELLREWRDEQQDRLEQEAEVALQSIRDARRELEYLEAQVLAAREGRSYDDVGQVNGVSAQAIFSTIARARQIEELDRSINDVQEES